MRMRLVWAVLVVLGIAGAVGCGSDNDADKAAPSTTEAVATTVTTSGVSTTAEPATATTAAGASSTTKVAGASFRTAVVEPDSVGGVDLGATKSEAIAVLGEPTATGIQEDLSGKTYDFLRWNIDGNRGLVLNFRTEAVTSPRLTDWLVTATGPATVKGIKVGDAMAKVTGAYGALQPFCCESQVASVTKGAGRMVVVVDSGAGTVTQIIGGDEAYWSRSIAD